VDITRLLMTVAFAAAALGLLLVSLWVFQRSLIYLPDRTAVPPIDELMAGGQEVTFETADGLTLRGWFMPAGVRGDGSAVLVLNGNAGNRAYRAPLATALSRRGVSVLLFDYRGYGDNPGMPSESGLLDDARAVRAYLAARPEVDPKRIVYFGESLGAAVAVSLALEEPPMALVLRSPFTSLVDMGRLHYPYLPIHPLLLRDQFASIDRISELRNPILVVVAEHDSIVPPAHSRRLFEKVQAPKRFVTIPGAGHNDLEMLDGEVLISEVVGFVREAGGK
jgi:fermentation-respiration switch protein FrsA (DUF1100 family)